MPTRTISVIVPAANEERHLGATIRAVREQSYPPHEVIVVVNGARDKTAQIARAHADTVLEFKKLKGYCFPKNQGARVARGDIILFLDADTLLSTNTLGVIARQCSTNTFGTVRGQGDSDSLEYDLYFAARNFNHATGVHKGAMGCMFVDRALFEHVGGFNEKLAVGEYFDFSKRATEMGGTYLYIDECSATTSVRRYEQQGGLLRNFAFWLSAAPRLLFNMGKKITRRDYPAMQ
ncbi:MAG: hypothetical protein A2542_02080 [Parcubacteria group bacterium RIFOXYD2_FULL_52_8]|nr:MAG: hypothetical protein A2542_02080 [Parcubacteria group bacterium RIFOXYD2_FULL_52_8]